MPMIPTEPTPETLDAMSRVLFGCNLGMLLHREDRESKLRRLYAAVVAATEKDGN